MANKKQLDLLKQGVKAWNQWRQDNLLTRADLSAANLKGAILMGANLKGADLSAANLMGANISVADLRKADLSVADLSGANISEADLREANLMVADLSVSNLSGANLKEASLMGAILKGADLVGADLHGANLSVADLSEADLSGADLSGADLSGANLYKLDATLCNFSRAILTGAYIQHWIIDRDTNLEGVACDYIYLEQDQHERRPHGGIFSPGEFTQRFQKFLETVDLFFIDGVDWKAFLASFQDLQTEYGSENITVQGIDRKSNSSFEIRLAITPEIDKAELEQAAYEGYKLRVKQLEDDFLQQLAAKDGEINHYRQSNDALKDELLDTYRHQVRQSSPLMMEEALKAIASLSINVNPVITVDAKAMSDSNSPKIDQSHAQIGIGVAQSVTTQQVSGVAHNYAAASNQDVVRLIAELRQLTQTFPEEEQENINLELDDLEVDLQQPEPNSKRIGQRLKRLEEFAGKIGAIAGGAATFSGNLNTFAHNVTELSKIVGDLWSKVIH